MIMLDGALVTTSFKDMTSGIKSENNRLDWKTVDVYNKSLPEGVNKKDVSLVTGIIKIEGISMFFRKALPSTSMKSSGEAILLLHGRSFKSETWQNLGTMNLMAGIGHLVVAVDLPGYGETQGLYHGDKSKFILSIIQSELLSGIHPVLISPSMSGEYSVKFVGEHADLLSGFIPVAPVATSSVSQDILQTVKVPTLIVYGENDNTPMAKEAPHNLRIMPNSREVPLKDAGHAAYLDQPGSYPQEMLRTVWKEEHFLANLIRNRKDQCLVFI
ncbi:protein ABHD14B-like isoform X3 [Zootermopsis nevadensis]|uniref:protein ABHD14B-like isoform X3 n=1 Tax=Zootermopsis nevadensis TaxID=136037 RepID=UPI000B8E9AE2|nr:protein ABHD14B-like isoform X3 [Zootermopsis nevadensis]